MSDNKVDNKLDFRNVKHSQFGGAQTDRAEFSELQSAKKVFNTNSILRDGYTDIIMQTNVDGMPTLVEYWQASYPATDKLQMSGDVGGNKAGTYFTLQEYTTKKTHVFWYRVSGSGTAPGIGDTETVIDIATNDGAAVVAFATNIVINNVNDFESKHPSSLASYIEITYNQFGNTDAVDVGTTGFIATRIVDGSSFQVGEICLDYDVDGNPIYNGNTYKNLRFNVPEARFDVEFDEIEVSAVANLDPIISKDPVTYNVSMPVAGTEYSQVIPIGVKKVIMQIQDHRGKYTVTWASGGAVITKSPGSTYVREGLEIVATKDTVYFSSTRNNLIMEIETWK